MTATAPEEAPSHDPPGITGADVARLILVAAAAVVVALHLWEPFPRVSVIGLAATIVGGWPIFAEAVEHLVDRRMTMELSMTIALAAALVIGEFFTALVITEFVLVAEILEGLTVGRGRRAIHDLLDFLPRTAARRRDGKVEEVPLSDLRAGDVVVVAPGARLPVDGRVAGGHSFVDQAAITGESKPIEKSVGDPVYAGTINQSGALDVLTERVGRDTSYGKIVDAVEQAERSRAPIQKTADRFAGYLVYFALACAALTLVITHNARSTISVIIVAGACGIAAGTPLAVLGAVGRAAREGVIIKGSRYLEALWGLDTVAFDKTGTVTLGRPVVRAVDPMAGVSARAVLEAAALAEHRSEHPLGKAILRRAEAEGLPSIEPETFAYTPGGGIVAGSDGDVVVVGTRAFLAAQRVTTLPPEVISLSEATVVMVARKGLVLGTLEIADAVRPEALGAMQALRGLGLRTVLLTGDAWAVANSVAATLGIHDVAAELLPDQKVRAVREQAVGGRVVAMVGDGINDAPALMEATVGVALGSGTDVARESADVVLLGNDLSRFVEAIRIARRARDIIRFNFVGTLTVDAIGVGLAAAGILNPLLAAFIHVSSELAFILNSARLLPGLRRAA
jgi:Cd2+/Zn2+-exporting ATPase/Cu+-exporting ATPase